MTFRAKQHWLHEWCISEMDHALSSDARDVTRQIEEFILFTSLHGDRRRELDGSVPSHLTEDLRRRRHTLISLVDDLLAHKEVLLDNDLFSCLRGHRQQLEDMLTPCRLMNLAAELREQIFSLAVTEWVEAPGQYVRNGTPPRFMGVLQQRAIRIDRLNKPAPPAITLVSRQVRAETLQLYYQLNVFECWRPFNYWNADWGCSTFIDWLGSLGEKTTWLRQYKRESELEVYDMERALAENGFDVRAKISHRRELSEYEMSYEAMGLPRYFGRQQRRRHG